MQNGFLAIDDNRMSCVMATLKPHDGGRAFGQQIHNLSLAFVTPLGADDNYVFCHGFFFAF